MKRSSALLKNNHMPEYIYTARTTEGKLKKDRLRVKDAKALEEYLKNQHLILTSSKEVTKKGFISFEKINNIFAKVSVVQKMFFTQNLAVMIRTGFSLAMALDTLAQQTPNKRFKSVIEEIKLDVENGISFSVALSRHPKVFSQLFVNMIAAGETSGKLDEVLKTLTNQMRKDHALISKVRSALMYPSVVVVAMIGIGVVMMITVIPQITSIYESNSSELPLPTRIVIGVSNLLIHQGIFILIGAILLIYAFMRFKKTNKGKRIWHTFLIAMPVFGSIIKKINIARFTRTLSSLLKTDIPIVQTLQIISKTLGNSLYTESMIKASEQVKKGVSIVKTLQEKPKLFPPVVTQMLAVGEESGTIDTISEEIANFFEDDVDQTMAGLSSIIEPILMLVIGGVVAVMALAILMPMYGLVQQI
ncbi:MAG: type II secretion system F family protein [Patescibacteria group bacterium]